MSDNVHGSVRFKAANFSKKISKFIANHETPLLAARKIFFEALRRIIDKTPVQFGRARSGWGAGAEAGGLQANYSNEEQREGRAKSTFRETGSGSVFKLVCVNGVDYVEYLEHGSSGQAPYGMVRISIAEIEEEMQLGGGLPSQVKAIYQAAWAEAGLGEGTEFRAGMLVEILPTLFTNLQVQAAAQRTRADGRVGTGAKAVEAELRNRGI